MYNTFIIPSINGFALAASDGNARTKQFNNTNSDDRNGTFMQTAIAGAINALTGGTDYSNGATHWAGDDIGSSREKRATGGLLFTEASHDMFGLGSKTKSGAPITEYYIHNGKKTSERGTYSYTWETTAAHGGTKPSGSKTGSTFMKKTAAFLHATAAPRF